MIVGMNLTKEHNKRIWTCTTNMLIKMFKNKK
jgi:hypothetical protein